MRDSASFFSFSSTSFPTRAVTAHSVCLKRPFQPRKKDLWKIWQVGNSSGGTMPHHLLGSQLVRSHLTDLRRTRICRVAAEDRLTQLMTGSPSSLEGKTQKVGTPQSPAYSRFYALLCDHAFFSNQSLSQNSETLLQPRAKWLCPENPPKQRDCCWKLQNWKGWVVQ